MGRYRKPLTMGHSSAVISVLKFVCTWNLQELREIEKSVKGRAGLSACIVFEFFASFIGEGKFAWHPTPHPWIGLRNTFLLRSEMARLCCEKSPTEILSSGAFYNIKTQSFSSTTVKGLCKNYTVFYKMTAMKNNVLWASNHSKGFFRNNRGANPT